MTESDSSSESSAFSDDPMAATSSTKSKENAVKSKGNRAQCRQLRQQLFDALSDYYPKSARQPSIRLYDILPV